MAIFGFGMKLKHLRNFHQGKRRLLVVRVADFAHVMEVEIGDCMVLGAMEDQGSPACRATFLEIEFTFKGHLRDLLKEPRLQLNGRYQRWVDLLGVNVEDFLDHWYAIFPEGGAIADRNPPVLFMVVQPCPRSPSYANWMVDPMLDELPAPKPEEGS